MAMMSTDRGSARATRRPKLTRLLWLWTPAVAAMAALAYASLGPVQPSDITGGAGSSFAIPQADKLMHVAAYAVFTVLVARALRASASLRPRGVALAAFGAASAYGGLLEYLQQFVGRGTSILDALSSIAGAALAALVWWLLARRTTRPRQGTRPAA